jgi:glycosyltransferase involved in cell wall biosynthesis
MEKIVFINQVASHLTKDIINAFAETYDDISLIAGSISETGNPLNKKVKLSHILKYNRKSILKRFLTWSLATVQIVLIINLKFRKYHLFITSNPPTLAFITLFCRNKYSVQILDIYPDALVSGGFISSSSWINKIWIKRNRKFFSDAANVFTLTEGMAETLSQYCKTDKLKVIPQWPSSTGYSKIERSNNKFIQANAMEKYFIVMYSGNIGLGHHVDILVRTAKILKDQKEILFVIIGEGWNKPLVEKLIKEYELSNCLLLPYQPESMFKHSIQAADIGVVSVSKELASLCVPIKTYNLINNEVPLLCITEGKSELAVLVSKYDIGKCFTPNQLNEMSDYIKSLKSDKERILRYKQNLRKCSENFTPKNAFVYVNTFKS